MPKNVADLRLNELDAMDATILAFYGRRPPDYAVYRTDQRVMIHFADVQKQADDQRRKMARLNPLRGEINGLVDGWRSAPDRSASRCRAERYDRRVGDALVVGFEGDVDGSELLLKAIKQDILAERIARGRVEYLFAALLAGVAGLLLIAVFTATRDYPAGALDLWRAGAAGAVGAFFSISLAMRGRTVLPDLERTANIMDAVLRVTIGMMAAAVLMALIRADVVTVRFGDRGLDAELEWLSVLIIGFVAGFSERFVPDLLTRAAGSTDAQPVPAAPPRGASREPAAEPPPDAAAASPGAEAGDGGDALPEEAATDACASDLELPDELVTADSELPAAAGGVERADQPNGRS